MEKTIDELQLEEEMRKLNRQFREWGITFDANPNAETVKLYIHWIEGFLPYSAETTEAFAEKLQEAARAVREFPYAGYRIAD